MLLTWEFHILETMFKLVIPVEVYYRTYKSFLSSFTTVEITKA